MSAAAAAAGPDLPPLRCALVGPSRTRTGLGPFLAEHFERSGAVIVGVSGRDPARTAVAARALEQRLGHAVPAHPDVHALLAEARPDALIVAAPIGAHLDALRAAAAARVHVFAEKPLVAPEQTDAALGVLDELAANGCLVLENCPWPLVLPAFPILYPSSLRQPRARVDMLLAPAGTGRDMVLEALSHFLSVLQALVPIDAATTVEAIRYSSRDAAARELELSFTLCGSFAPLAAGLWLQHAPTQPRPAWLALNGLRIERRVAVPASASGSGARGYTWEFFAGSERTVMGDPMAGLVYRFAQLARRPDLDRTRTESEAVRLRAKLFQRLVLAFDDAAGG